MKKLFSALMIASVVLLSLSGCSKNDDDTNNPASGPFVAKVAGTQFPTATYSAKYVTSTKMLQIIGQAAGSTETINLSLMPLFNPGFTYWTPGTYEFKEGSEYIVFGEYNIWPNGMSENSKAWQAYAQGTASAGKIVITSITDTHVKGTFEFKGTLHNNDGTYNTADTKQITDGAFDLPITRL